MYKEKIILIPSKKVRSHSIKQIDIAPQTIKLYLDYCIDSFLIEKAYRYAGTATASADNVKIYDNGSCLIEFDVINKYLKNCTIIVAF